jgi:beta-glucosidase
MTDDERLSLVVSVIGTPTTIRYDEGGPQPAQRGGHRSAGGQHHGRLPAVHLPGCVPMLRVAIELGAFPMPGVGTVPPEGMEGLKAEVDTAHSDVEQYARDGYGALSLAEAVRRLLPDADLRAVAATGVLPSHPTDIAAAVAAAGAADAVILYIGGKGGWYGDDLTEKEGGDTADIDLPPQQVELVRAVTALGKPTVAVVSLGRPQGLGAVIDRLPAVITAYYGGPYQGIALADAIFGVTNPSGRLPITMPRHSGQVPIHHGQHNGSGYRRTRADIHGGYLDLPSTPLFAFGHGLSYTTFAYGPLRLERDTVDVGGEARISPTVTNTGKRRGTEVVQLYAADTAVGVTLPAEKLIGFSRVELDAGRRRGFVRRADEPPGIHRPVRRCRHGARPRAGSVASGRARC